MPHQALSRSTQEARDKEAREKRERRAAGERRPIDLRVDIIDGGFRHACQLRDLSTQGMSIALSPSLAAREPRLVMTCEIELDDGRVIPVTARTAWRRGGWQGVRFINLGRAEQHLLRLALAKRGRISDVDRLELAEFLDRAHLPPRRAA